MAELKWDQAGEKVFETGLDRGVLYLPSNLGVYDKGYAWNGLTAVSENPSGAEANKVYADNGVYASLVSAEIFEATVEAFTYPDEFAVCDGTAEIVPGVQVGQQSRKAFGLAYRTRVGNDIEGDSHGYKIHLIYNALAKPSQKQYKTINDSPEALSFSWDMTTTPVDVPGFKPAAQLTIDSTKVNSADLAALEALLYGTSTNEPKLPLPGEVAELFASTTDAPDAP